MPDLEKIITHSKNLGISECEVIHVKRKVTTVRITDSEIAEIKQNQEENLGIRIFKENRISTAQTNSLECSIELLEKAHQMATFLKPRDFWKSLPSKCSHSQLDGTFDKKLVEIEGKEAADIAQEMINSASKEKISSISGSLNIVTEKFRLENSNGLNYENPATYVSGMINADSGVQSELISGIGQESCRTLDAFTPEKIGDEAAAMCLGSINPKNCQADE